ncbi:MAG: sigma-54-dependent Fis family transcriptional regulator [Spirochaetes bacterium]|nr:sigma-54-dependent Fis family transcriptional regulator [Spirochaetota bacterium]
MTVFVVDDEADCCDDLSSFVRAIGHTVTGFTDPRAALDAIIKEPPDVIITDVNMPYINGIELFSRIREKNCRAEVIFISGKAETIESINAMERGVYDFFIKPVDVSKVAEALSGIAGLRAAETGKLPAHTLAEAVAKLERIAVDEVTFSPDDFPGPRYGEDIGIFSERMKAVYRKLKKLREYPNTPVLIEGETGTGKEIIAQFLHYGGSLSDERPFIAINCPTIGKDIFESELFGYEGGAFTGADPKGRAGKIKAAEDGTLFLDEVTELDTGSQAKLLRVLQENEYYRVGGTTKIHTNARIVCATNLAMENLVARGLFRSDLYYRLNVCKISLPPLRDRREEIAPLAVLFVKECNRKFGKTITHIESAALTRLAALPWTGNIRELKNVITNSMLFKEGATLTAADFPVLLGETPAPIAPSMRFPDTPFDLQLYVKKAADDMSVSIIEEILKKFNGNKTKAAEFLKLSRMQFYRLYKK